MTRFLFAGEYVDPVGDYYLRNRVYDPESAGFLSVDPVVGATGMPFAYTGGNPLQGTDPLGLFGLGDIGGWLGDGVGWIADRAGDVWDYVTSPTGFASTVTYVGCLFLTGGIGVVGCSAVSGAVYGALEYGANVPMECWSVSDFFKTTATFALWGAGLGVLFGPMSSVAGSWMRAAVNRVAPTWLKQSVGTAVQSTKAAVTQFGQAVKQRAGNGLTQFRAAGERGSIGPSGARPVKAFASPDPHVAVAANAIEAAMPGRVLGVNSLVTMRNGLRREVDIDLGGVIIQVKGGSARGISGQIAATTSTTGRTAIGYAPGISNAGWETAARQGIPIARTFDELIAIIEELG